MAVMDLVVSGTTYPLPQPMQNGYTEDPNYRTSTHRVASGALAREGTSNAAWWIFTLEWAFLTATQKTVVDNAVAAMIDGTSGSFTLPTNSTVTVVLGEDGAPKWEIRKVKGNTAWGYSGRLVLEKSA